MRSIWKGQVGFGLISMPCKLYTACDDKRVSFHQIHAECGSRIKMPKWCPVCERQIDGTEIVKGYEMAKDSHILLTENDFASLPLKSLKQIELVSFIRDTVDPRAFDSCYYLSPDKGGEKPFSLISKVMARLEVKAVGKLAYREREHLCLISPFDGVLLVQTLHYADEIRAYDEIKAKEVALSDKEIELGEMLVKQMMNGFDYASFQDEYRQAMEELIQAKVEGREIVSVEAGEAPAGDLVSQLLASVGMK